METIKTKERFIELRAQGYSFDKIAGKLKVAKVTLVNWAKEYEEEITNHKALELEALYEKYSLLKEHRVKHFGEMLEKIRTELNKRDLKDIPTDKLLDIYNKTYIIAKDEVTELKFRSTEEIREEKQDRELLDELTAPDYSTGSKLKAV